MNETDNLSQTDKNELKNITKAYTTDEYETIVKCIPDEFLWVEIIRRYNVMTKGVEFVAEILGVSVDNIVYISANTWQDIRGKYDDLKEKFQKIRKGTGAIGE